MFVPIEFKDCKIGMTVRVMRASEQWIGTVRAVKKPLKYVIIVDVPTYIKDGTKRDRWVRKIVSFANSTKVSAAYDTVAWQDFLQKQRETRKAYAGARSVLTQKRDEMTLAFEALGLQVNCTQEEFKAIQRAGFKKYHPDLIPARTQGMSGKQIELYKQQADAFIKAAAFVDHYLKRRDS